MKKLTLLISLILLFSASIFAQTKRIAHRSHSGTSIHHSLLESDNLGLPPEMERRFDSINALNIKRQDSIKKANRLDSIKRTEKAKKSNKKKKTTVKPQPIKEKKQKTKPLPPNEESRKTPPKSNFLLLFLIAVPAGVIAFFSKKV